MAKFKKLAILCVSLMMTASLGAVVGCSDNSSSTSSSSSSSAPKTEYTVTVTKPENVTIAGTLTAEEGADVTFTATVDASYVLSATGATQVGDTTTADGKTTYTYKVAAIAEDTAVTITATQIHTSGPLAEQLSELSIPANGSFTGTLTASGNETVYAIAWEKENLVVKLNGVALENGDIFSVDGSVQIVFTSSDGAALESELYIAPFPDPYEVTVGEAVDVEIQNAMMGQVVYFTAEAAGDYIVKLAKDEEDAVIMGWDADNEEIYSIEDSFLGNTVIKDVEANETVYLCVLNESYEPTTVTLTIEKHEPQEIAACYQKVDATRQETMKVRTDTTVALNLDAGVYYIVGANEYTTLNWSRYIMLQVTEAGDQEITVTYNDDRMNDTWTEYITPEGTSCTAEFDVYKVTTASATNAYGTATLLSNANTPFTFSVAEAGVYAFEFTDNSNLSLWNEDYGEFMAACYGSPYYFVATEANQQFTVYVSAYDDAYENYDFEWNITKVTPTALTIGKNTHTMKFHDVLVTSFTATEAGAYCIDSGDYVCVGLFVDGIILDHDGEYNYNYGNFYFDLNENETIYLFLNFDSSEAPEGPLTHDFAVSRYGNVGERPKVATPVNLYPDSNTEVFIYANSEANGLGTPLNLYGNGDFTLTWNNNDVTVYVNGDLYTGNVISLSMWGGTPPVVVAHNASNADITCEFCLEMYVAPVAPLQVGTNSYDLSTASQGFIIVDFEVEAGKTYTFETTNCVINGVTGDIESYPDSNEITTYEATSDTTIQLAICQASLDTNATVKVTESQSSAPVVVKWTKNY